MFQISADEVLASPMVLIGTPDECIKELKRREQKWGVAQFLISDGAGAIDEKIMRRLREEVIAHL